MSSGSVHSDEGQQYGANNSPQEKSVTPIKTPKERKRKRKTGEEGAEPQGASSASKGPRKGSDSNRPISDYFGKPVSSPGRGHGGAKSPSPSGPLVSFPGTPTPPYMGRAEFPGGIVPGSMGDFPGRMNPPRHPMVPGMIRGPTTVTKAVQTDLTRANIEEL